MIFKTVSRKFVMGLVGLASLAILVVSGCSKDESDSVTNPNAKSFQPKGTIQGVVRDAVTLQPIVGALVSVDLKSDKTDKQGSYVIKDVPATADALNNTVFGAYTIEVDLSNAYTEDELGDVDLDMRKDSTTPRYPRITYSSVSVYYTSLNDSTPCPGENEVGDEFDVEDELDELTNCGTNATNHDTPVDGLVATTNIHIGKLACNIRGFVYGCDDSPTFATVQPNFEVKLVNDDCEGGKEGNSGSGQCGNTVGTDTTDATGMFEFANIECGGRDFDIVVADSFLNPTLDDSQSVTGPFSDGETLVLDLEHEDNSDIPKDSALHVCVNDDLRPRIIVVSPEHGSDLAPVGQVVSVQFHESIQQTARVGVDPSAVGNLFDDIEVNYDGAKPKAGNQAYSVAWSQTAVPFDTLTVTFDTEGAGLYHVKLPSLTGRFTDSAQPPNSATLGVCPDDSLAPAAWGIAVDPDLNDCTIWFSTNGGIDPGTATLTLVNSSSLDEGTSVVGIYDWNALSGAKDYRMYCRKVQVWDSGLATVSSLPGAWLGNDDDSPNDDGIGIVGSGATIDFDTFEQGDGGTDGVSFVENDEIALHYDCYVVGVNADRVESVPDLTDADANGIPDVAVRAQDRVGPEFDTDGPPSAGALNCVGPGTGATSGSGPLAEPTDIGSICGLSIADGGDGVATTIDQIVLGYTETMREGPIETIGNYTLDPSFGATTITAARANVDNDLVLLTLSVGGVLPASLPDATITAGPNGIINTGVAGDDVLVRPTCVTEGSATDETEAVDDVDSTPGIPSGIINVGPNGICDTAAAGVGAVQTEGLGEGLASSACVGPGPNGVINPTTLPVVGDDVLAGTRINSGPNGVCETTATGDDDQLVGVGAGLPSTSIRAGVNKFLNSIPPTLDDVVTSPTVITGGPALVDVNNNAIRDTGNEFTSNGRAQ
jgi:hypothetical protein